MKIQASAQPQTSQLNGAPAGGRDQQTPGGFDDVLAGAEGATAGAGAQSADAAGGSPALTGTMPKLAALLSQVAAVASSGSAPAGPSPTAPTQTAQGQQVAPSVSLAWSTVTGGAASATPAAVPATADAAAALSTAALAGTAEGGLTQVGPAGRRSSGTRDQTATANSASGATGPVNPTADLMTFLSAAILRNGTTGTGGGAGAQTNATASGQTAQIGPGGSSGAAGPVDTIGTVDEDQPPAGLALSGLTIEGHLAPVTGKLASPTGDVELAASARLMPGETADASAMTPLRAIASSISSLAAQGSASSPATQGQASAVPDDVTTGAPMAARTMTLQLSPAHLGTVSVRLHVTGQTLDVELSLSDQQTLGLVSRERDVLASALRGQNYDLHSLVIQGADTSTGQSGLQYASDHGSGSGGAASSGDRSATGNGNSDGAGQGAQGGTGRQPRGEEAGAVDGSTRPAVDALFV